ncbi:hypothetical protein ACVUO4_005157, partial [Escherichia coli]
CNSNRQIRDAESCFLPGVLNFRQLCKHCFISDLSLVNMKLIPAKLTTKALVTLSLLFAACLPGQA